MQGQLMSIFTKNAICPLGARHVEVCHNIDADVLHAN